jgi:hypothetical protein
MTYEKGTLFYHLLPPFQQNFAVALVLGAFMTIGYTDEYAMAIWSYDVHKFCSTPITPPHMWDVINALY